MPAPGGVGLLPGGMPGLGGLSAPGGSVSQHALRQNPPPVNRMTNRCKNITLATTSLRPVIKCLNCADLFMPCKHSNTGRPTLEIRPMISRFLPPANDVCEGYVFTGVCLSTGVCVADTPWAGTPPPDKYTPFGQVHPQGRYTPPPGRYIPPLFLRQTVSKWAVRILLECNLVYRNKLCFKRIP